MKAVAIAGTGRLARALALALRGAEGFRLTGVWGRRRQAVEAILAAAGTGAALTPAGLFACDVVCLAVADDALATVAAELARAAPARLASAVWLHGSGALGLEPLAPLRALGLRTATLHPLASLQPDAPEPLRGCPLIVGGEPEARQPALALAAALGGQPFWVDALDRPLYHAAAALLANGLTALFSLGSDLLARASSGALGAAQAHALVTSALLPLRSGEPATALTGPVRRGDHEVVRRHRAALAAHDPQALAAYDALMARALALAERAGLPADRAAAVAAVLEERP